MSLPPLYIYAGCWNYLRRHITKMQVKQEQAIAEQLYAYCESFISKDMHFTLRYYKVEF